MITSHSNLLYCCTVRYVFTSFLFLVPYRFHDVKGRTLPYAAATIYVSSLFDIIIPHHAVWWRYSDGCFVLLWRRPMLCHTAPPSAAPPRPTQRCYTVPYADTLFFFENIFSLVTILYHAIFTFPHLTAPPSRPVPCRAVLLRPIQPDRFLRGEVWTEGLRGFPEGSEAFHREFGCLLHRVLPPADQRQVGRREGRK